MSISFIFNRDCFCVNVCSAFQLWPHVERPSQGIVGAFGKSASNYSQKQRSDLRRHLSRPLDEFIVGQRVWNYFENYWTIAPRGKVLTSWASYCLQLLIT